MQNSNTFLFQEILDHYEKEHCVLFSLKELIFPSIKDAFMKSLTTKDFIIRKVEKTDKNILNVECEIWLNNAVTRHMKFLIKDSIVYTQVN